jgi:predicted metal-dependent hydrolase
MEIALTVVCFLILWTYISFNWYGWKINIELWQLRINKNKEKITRKSYKSVDELWEDLDKKEVWYRRILLHIKWKMEYFFDIPSDVYRFFKRGLQRWARGWADEDVWSINNFLSEIIPPMLKRLKETKHGIPTIVGKMRTDEEVGEAEKQWEEILDSIIWTFKTSKKIDDNELAYFKKWSQKKCDKYNKIWIDWKYEPKPRAMTKEECKQYESGWSNLKKYYFNLWD